MIKQRLLTAFALGGMFLLALYFLSDPFWSLFLLFFIVIAAIEWAGLVGFTRIGRMVFPIFILSAGLLLLPGMSVPMQLQIALYAILSLSAGIFWVLIAPFWLKSRWRFDLQIVNAAVGTLLLLGPWVALVHLRQQIGPSFVLIVMATVWLADSAAYFSGKRFGRHKLAPQISPGKTWEGAYGAMFAVTVFAIMLCAALGVSLIYVLGFLVVALWSIIGDLFESMVKRQAGKKDSGTLFPGHGGVLDRIDGLTSTLPLVTCMTLMPTYLSLLASR